MSQTRRELLERAAAAAALASLEGWPHDALAGAPRPVKKGTTLEHTIVRGLELVELPGAEQCCGFGGTFAVKNADTSTAMLTDKMANILGTHAEVCTAGDASCLMHIGGGLSRLRSGTRTVHLAEILASTEEAVAPHQATRPSLSTRPTTPTVPA